ncbi:MAG: hypothetical protein QM702_21105 [Rubrivivax sp.]
MQKVFVAFVAGAIAACGSVDRAMNDGADAGPSSAPVEAGARSTDEGGASSDAAVADAGMSSCGRAYGGPDLQLVSGVTSDGSGNIVVTGSFWKTTNLGGGDLTSVGDNDGFVATYDARCHLVYARVFAGAGDQYVARVATDSGGNVFVVVNTQSPLDVGTTSGAVLVKLSPSGATVWSRNIGASATSVYGLAIGKGGELFLGGSAKATTDLGGGPIPSGGFVLALDPSGAYLWSRPAGASVSTLDVDLHGDVHAMGFGTGQLDLGGGPLDLTGTPSPRGFVLKSAGKTGDHLASTANPGPNALVTDAAGDLYVAGVLRDEIANFGDGPLADPNPNGTLVARSGYLVKLSGATYAPIWSHGFGSSVGPVGTISPTWLTRAPSSDIVMATNSTGSIDFGGGVVTSTAPETAMLVTFTPNGAWKAGASFAGTRFVFPTFTPSGNLLVAGRFGQPSVTVGGINFLLTSAFDSFFVRFGE